MAARGRALSRVTSSIVWQLETCSEGPSDRIMAQSSYSFWQPDGSPTLGSGGPVGSGAVVPIGWTFGGGGLSNFLPGYVPPDPALGYYLAGVEFSRDVLLEAGDCVIFDDLQIIYSPELGTGP